MAVVLWGFLRLVPTQNAWLRGLGGILIGAATFVLVTWLLRSPEIAFVLAAARSRVAK
jgi:hypothetical protein